MQTNLLKKTMLFTMISASLAGCGSDTGKDYNFNADTRVEFPAEALEVSIDEALGLIEVDLLAGATVDGQAIDPADSTIYVRNFRFEPLNEAFTTPQAPGAVASQPISPFTMSDDKTKLVIDTDAFGSSLRSCDTTDVRGAKDADDNNIADGVPDFPQSITYSVNYVIDNGFDLAPGEALEEREILLTINAADDTVTEVVAGAIELPAGGTKQLNAQTNPNFACEDLTLTYAVADETIATINQTTGEVTGVSQGTTEATVTHTASGTATTTNVTVTSGFSLAITNQPKDALGSPTGMKEVPACTMTGVTVEPSNSTDALSGAYTYSFTASNNDVVFDTTHSSGFGATGMFSTGTVNPSDLDNLPTTDVTVGYLSGDTGANNAADTADKSIELTVVPNIACNSTDNYVFDSKFDVSQGDFKTISDGFGPIAHKPTAGINGSGAVSFVRNANALTGDAVAGVNFQSFKANSLWAANYGVLPDSHGKTIKASMWVKVIKADPTNTDDVTVSHHILPWTVLNGPVRQPKRELGPNFKATVPASVNGEWVYLEFIDEHWTTGEEASDTFVVPTSWVNKNGDSQANVTVIPEWIFEGLSTGDEVLIDEYSIVE